MHDVGLESAATTRSATAGLPFTAAFNRAARGMRGRPRRLMPSANDLFSQELYRMVDVKEGGKATKMPLIQALFRAYLAIAVKGHGPALRSLMPLIQDADRLREQTAAKAQAEEPSSRELARAVLFTLAEADVEENGTGDPRAFLARLAEEWDIPSTSQPS